MISQFSGIRLNVQNPLVMASLIELVDKSYVDHRNETFKQYGITFQRLEFLGDAVLDIIVTQFLYKDLRLTKGEISIEGRITKLRSLMVQNDCLGFNFVYFGLYKYINWAAEQKDQVELYKSLIDQLEEQQELSNQEMDQDDDDDAAELVDWWYLTEETVKPPKCLGDAFEVLLAIVFIHSNMQYDGDMNDDMNHNHAMHLELKYDLNDCIAFLRTFHDYFAKHYPINFQ